MEMFRRNDETELALTVFPTINENFSAEKSFSLLSQELMDEELFALDIALEKKEDETSQKKNVIYYSEEFIIEDRSENVLFLESTNKTVKRIVIAQLSSETKPRIFEVVERTEMTQIFNYIIESREVVVNGEKYIYQYRQGAEASVKIESKEIEVEAAVDFKAKLDFKDTELTK